MAKLTEKTLATAVTLNSLIHIVNTGDTTQSAYGSSYKAELSQLVPLFGSNPDVTVTGGTYNPSTGEITFYNNTGGTFNVSGFITGFTDSYVSGGTYSSGTATFTNTTGGTFNVNGFYTGSSEFYVSDGSLNSNRTVTQGSFDLDFNGNENSRLQTTYVSSINPLDNGSFTSRVGATDIIHNDDTNDLFFGSTLTPGNSSMNVGVLSTNESAGVSFNSGSTQLQHYDGATTTREIKVDISGVSINQEYYFPNADGSNGQVLTTDGSGNTSWEEKCNCTSFSAITLTANTVFSERIRGKLGPIAVNDTDLGNVHFGSTSGVTIDVPNQRIGIKTATPTEELDVSGKTKTINFQMTSGATSGYVLTSDASGNATWQVSSGGGVSIDPYTNVGNTGTTLTWNVSGNSTNYQATLTGNTTLDLTNVRNGDYGTIIVTQDAVGSRTITFGTVNGAGSTHRVANGGGGSPTLTSNANAIDILTFTYNGSGVFWTVGNDYT